MLLYVASDFAVVPCHHRYLSCVLRQPQKNVSCKVTTWTCLVFYTVDVIGCFGEKMTRTSIFRLGTVCRKCNRRPPGVSDLTWWDGENQRLKRFLPNFPTPHHHSSLKPSLFTLVSFLWLNFSSKTSKIKASRPQQAVPPVIGLPVVEHFFNSMTCDIYGTWTLTRCNFPSICILAKKQNFPKKKWLTNDSNYILLMMHTSFRLGRCYLYMWISSVAFDVS